MLAAAVKAAHANERDEERFQALEPGLVALLVAARWDEAEGVAHSIQVPQVRLQLLARLYSSLVPDANYDHLLGFVQRSWRLAETQAEAFGEMAFMVIMLQSSNPAGERLKAALDVLDQLVKLSELNKLEQRITKIEEQSAVVYPKSWTHEKVRFDDSNHKYPV